MVMIANSTFSQQTKPTPTLTKQDYLQKSKSQKTTAFILLGIGATAVAIAAPGNVSFDVLPVLVIGGGLATLGSIPLFIASGKNKRKAKQISFKMQQTPQLQISRSVNRAFPSLNFKLSL